MYNSSIYLKKFSNSTVFKRNLIFAFLEAECYSWKEHKLVQESQFCHFSAALPWACYSILLNLNLHSRNRGLKFIRLPRRRNASWAPSMSRLQKSFRKWLSLIPRLAEGPKGSLKVVSLAKTQKNIWVLLSEGPVLLAHSQEESRKIDGDVLWKSMSSINSRYYSYISQLLMI